MPQQTWVGSRLDGIAARLPEVPPERTLRRSEIIKLISEIEAALTLACR